METQGENAAPAGGGGRQNGAGRHGRRDAGPEREAEPALETAATVSEPEPPSKTHAESQDEPEAPRRRGWWQR